MEGEAARSHRRRKIEVKGHGEADGQEKAVEKKEPLEHEIQAAYFDWVRIMRLKHPEMENIYAIPNGAHLADGRRSYKRLYREGFKPGVLDVNIDIPRREFHGARLEFKRRGKKPSPEQERQARLNTRLGYCCYLCTDTVTAIRATCEYLGIKDT